MELSIIFLIIVIHWLADFVFQTHWQATNKSTNNKALFEHVLTYTSTWLVLYILFILYSNINLQMSAADYGYDGKVLLFFPITFVAHFITDYFTSRLNSYLYKKGDIHNFFVSVGFDQILHYVQLFLTINWLFL